MNTATKTTWAIDPTHSEIGFKVKHMMFTNVSGKFENFNASVVTEGDDFENPVFSFTGEVNSLTTGNKDRDAHLLSADFFDAASFPQISFESTKVQEGKLGDLEITGNLTIKGISNTVTLEAEFGGIMKDPWGNIKAGVSIIGKINRKDWDLNWNAALETGGVLVGEEVRLVIDLQFVKQ